MVSVMSMETAPFLFFLFLFLFFAIGLEPRWGGTEKGFKLLLLLLFSQISTHGGFILGCVKLLLINGLQNLLLHSSPFFFFYKTLNLLHLYYIVFGRNFIYLYWYTLKINFNSILIRLLEISSNWTWGFRF